MKTIVITGATSGIGFETAKLLAAKGFRIIGIGRSEQRCTRAKTAILAAVPEAEVSYFTADLMQQREVNHIAAVLTDYIVSDCGGQLFALINNAGCARGRYMTTEDGYEQQFALNYLSAFLLTYRLLPLIRAANGRVLMTGSQSHKGSRVHWNDVMLSRRYGPLTAYKQSKLCGILFCEGLKRSLRAARRPCLCSGSGTRAHGHRQQGCRLAGQPGLVAAKAGRRQSGNTGKDLRLPLRSAGCAGRSLLLLMPKTRSQPQGHARKRRPAVCTQRAAVRDFL